FIHVRQHVTDAVDELLECIVAWIIKKRFDQEPLDDPLEECWVDALRGLGPKSRKNEVIHQGFMELISIGPSCVQGLEHFIEGGFDCFIAKVDRGAAVGVVYLDIPDDGQVFESPLLESVDTH